MCVCVCVFVWVYISVGGAPIYCLCMVLQVSFKSSAPQHKYLAGSLISFPAVSWGKLEGSGRESEEAEIATNVTLMA